MPRHFFHYMSCINWSTTACDSIRSSLLICEGVEDRLRKYVTITFLTSLSLNMTSDTPMFFTKLYCKVLLAVNSQALFTASRVLVDFTFSLTCLWHAVRKFQNYQSCTSTFIFVRLHRVPHNVVKNMLRIEMVICRIVWKRV